MIYLLFAIGRSIQKVQNKKWLYKKWLLLWGSAWGLNAAFFFPHYFFWLVFLFLVPIFYLAFHNLLSFGEGFVWGLLFAIAHYLPLIRIVGDNYRNYGGLLLISFLLLYVSVYAGLWFFVSKKGASFYSNNLALMGIWILGTYLYFVWMSSGALFIFGQWMGDPFAWPIIPLAYSPRWLIVVSFLPKTAILLLLIVLSALIAFYVTYREKRYIIPIFLIFLPFALGSVYKTDDPKLPICCKKIGYLAPPDYDENAHPIDVAQNIYYRLAALLEKRPDIKLIVMPESSYRFSLNKQQHVVDIWAIHALESRSFLIGSQRSEGPDVYNTAYLIEKGKIIDFYDKRYLMPLAEFIPTVYRNRAFFRDILLKENGSFCCGNVQKKKHITILNRAFEPYICYDFFFGSFLDKTTIPIILFVNDTYFQTSYMCNMMLLYAKFKALDLKRDILYVGYYNATWINKSGKSLTI